eukprot:1375404-Pyramimonas_sp.AAC.1
MSLIAPLGAPKDRDAVGMDKNLGLRGARSVSTSTLGLGREREPEHPTRTGYSQDAGLKTA